MIRVDEYIGWMLMDKTSGIPSHIISRERFLEEKLQEYYPKSTVANVIKTNPAYAGIPRSTVGEIAQKVIEEDVAAMSANFKERKAQGKTEANEVVPFLSCLYGTAQKILYLYGMGEIRTKQQCWFILGELIGIGDCLMEMDELTDSYAIKLMELKSANAAMDLAWSRIDCSPMIDHLAEWVLGLIAADESPLTEMTARKRYYKECCVRVRNQMKEASISDPNYYLLIQ